MDIQDIVNKQMATTNMSLVQKIFKKMVFPIVMLIILNLFFSLIYVITCNDHEDWNGIEEEDDDTILSKLFNRFYFAMTTSTTVGYGDISPKSTKARCIVMTHFLFILMNALTIFI
tara:strand:- start:112 stop:459 length:348 start_codon:yes stop_codon:yes gene_type:complete